MRGEISSGRTSLKVIRYILRSLKFTGILRMKRVGEEDESSGGLVILISRLRKGDCLKPWLREQSILQQEVWRKKEEIRPSQTRNKKPNGLGLIAKQGEEGLVREKTSERRKAQLD